LDLFINTETEFVSHMKHPVSITKSKQVKLYGLQINLQLQAIISTKVYLIKGRLWYELQIIVSSADHLINCKLSTADHRINCKLSFQLQIIVSNADHCISCRLSIQLQIILSTADHRINRRSSLSTVANRIKTVHVFDINRNYS